MRWQNKKLAPTRAKNMSQLAQFDFIEEYMHEQSAPQYYGWYGKAKQPIGDVLADAIAAYAHRFGRQPVEALVNAGALAQLGDVGLTIESREWVWPGYVFVR